MPDRMIQVPESLIEKIESELEYRVRTVASRVRMAEKHDEQYPREWVDNEVGAGRERVRALLSQPTPTAEPQYERNWELEPGAAQREAEPVTLDQRAAATFGPEVLERTGPPRIEDMAPGTTFVGDWGGYVTGGLFVRLNDGVRCLTPGRAFSGWAMTLASAALDIDPSTIRDVAPPEKNS